MKVAFFIVQLISVIMEMLIVGFVIKSISPSRFSKIKEICAYLAVFCVRSIIISFVRIPTLEMLLSFFTVFILSCFYKIAYAKKLIIAVLMTLIFVLTEMLVGFIVSSFTKASIEETRNSINFFVECTLGSKLIVFLLAQGFKMFLTKDSAKLSKGMYASLILLPLSTCLIVFATSEVMYNNNNLTLTILMIIGIISILVANYILMFVAEKNIQQVITETKNEIFTQELIQQTKYYEDLIQKYKIDNKKLHDIDKHFLVLQSMIDYELYNKASEQIIKVEKIINDAKSIGFTGIISIDAIINNTISKIKDTNIQFRKHIFIESLSDNFEMDFCLLLGNLLDNAVEECQRLEKTYDKVLFVDCEVKQIDNYLNILVENSTTNLKINEQTSKRDEFQHGYGRQIIQEIVEKYNGNIKTEKINEIYTTMIILEVTR